MELICHALAAAGGAGYEHVGQGSQVQGHRSAAGVLPHCDGQTASCPPACGTRRSPKRRADAPLVGVGTGTSIPTRAAAWHRGLDPEVGRHQRQGQVFLAGDDALHLDPAALACPPSPFSPLLDAFLDTQPGERPNCTTRGPALMSVTSTRTPWSPSACSTCRAMPSQFASSEAAMEAPVGPAASTDGQLPARLR